MNIREKLEHIEEISLSQYASHSKNSLGRDRVEKECDMRTVYQRDRDRILHCKAFRRLKHKTQVFLAPAGDHYRTRLTHTLEVSQIARSISKALSLNEDLTEAIALGHDLGHTPFGHAGERALDTVCSFGFAHYRQSVRIVERLERNGAGLNLTKEVRDGILNHRTSGNPFTLEGKVVRLSDKIAYINHDIDDAIRAGILKEEDIPAEYTGVLGTTRRSRLDSLIRDIVSNSIDKNDICMSAEHEYAMQGIRSYMFEYVYKNKVAKSQEAKAESMIISLYEYYLSHQHKMPSEFTYLIEELGESPERVVCDYISGMSDQYSVLKFEENFVPKFWI